MKTEIKSINQCVKELEIIIDAEKALQDYKSTLGGLRKMAVVPGFRKGKAPLSMVERLYGDAVKDEYFRNKIDEYYEQALKETELQPIAQPELLDSSWEKGEDFTAKFKIEVAPEIKIENYKGLEVQFEEKVVDEKELENTLKNLCLQNSYNEDVDAPAEEGSYVKIMMKISEDNEVEREVIAGENQYGEAFNKDLIGKKADEMFKTSIFEGENKKEVEVIVVAVQKRVVPELNDDFAKDLEFDNLDALKAKVKEDLEEQAKIHNYNGKIEAIYTAIAKANPFDVPESQIKQYAAQMANDAAKQYRMPAQQLMPLYQPMAEAQLKQYYIMAELMKTIEMEVTDADKEEIIAEASESLKLSIEEYKEKYAKQIASEDFTLKVKERKIMKMIEAESTFVPFPKEETKNDEELEEITIEEPKE